MTHIAQLTVVLLAGGLLAVLVTSSAHSSPDQPAGGIDTAAVTIGSDYQALCLLDRAGSKLTMLKLDKTTRKLVALGTVDLNQAFGHTHSRGHYRVQAGAYSRSFSVAYVVDEVSRKVIAFAWHPAENKIKPLDEVKLGEVMR
jgi:hypothetical protein